MTKDELRALSAEIAVTYAGMATVCKPKISRGYVVKTGDVGAAKASERGVRRGPIVASCFAPAGVVTIVSR